MGKNPVKDTSSQEETPRCFVIMPISDPPGYPEGHFRHVYDDLIQPACEMAGFEALRADEVKETNFIQVDILNRLLETPMAICDLSSHNPNVLFELALRQAFDKPVALIQEEGTPKIFDISPFRYTSYRKELLYREVPVDQEAIAEGIRSTYEAHEKDDGVNSIVKLLSLRKRATLPKMSGDEASEDMLELVLSEMNQLRREMRDMAEKPIVYRPREKALTDRDREIVMLEGMIAALEDVAPNCFQTGENVAEFLNTYDLCGANLRKKALDAKSPSEAHQISELTLRLNAIQRQYARDISRVRTSAE